MKNKRAYFVTGAAVLCAALLFGMAASGCGSASGTDNVTGVTLSRTELSMQAGSTASLRASVATADGSEYYGNVSWSSSDETVATVSSGVVYAVSEGEATISVEVPGTRYSAQCAVSVHEEDLSVFRVGVKDDVANFGQYIPNDLSYEGMEVDLGKMLADALGYEDVEYVALAASEREDALANGDVDCVIATYSITAERRDLVNFSASYYTDYVRVLALGGYADSLDEPSLASVSACLAENGGTCTVGTVEGTTAYTAFTDYCIASDIAMTDPATGNEIYTNVEYGDYDLVEEALEAGEIDLFVGDYSILSGYKSGQDEFLEDLLEAQEYGVATALGSPLTDRVNALIDEWLEDGTIDTLLAGYGLERTTAATGTTATAGTTATTAAAASTGTTATSIAPATTGAGCTSIAAAAAAATAATAAGIIG